jgi:hypothetical protein
MFSSIGLLSGHAHLPRGHRRQGHMIVWPAIGRMWGRNARVTKWMTQVARSDGLYWLGLSSAYFRTCGISSHGDEQHEFYLFCFSHWYEHIKSIRLTQINGCGLFEGTTKSVSSFLILPLTMQYIDVYLRIHAREGNYRPLVWYVKSNTIVLHIRRP